MDYVYLEKRIFFNYLWEVQNYLEKVWYFCYFSFVEISNYAQDRMLKKIWQIYQNWEELSSLTKISGAYSINKIY